MDFELTQTQKQIRLAAREFAEGEFPGVAREYDRREEFPKEQWKKGCELGFIGVFIKKEYGGLGYIADYDIERFYRDEKIVEIYEGTKEIEKNMIAREILGRL
jgi:alkylation response protein AidB-like acyl-CoA dehydrogenase